MSEANGIRRFDEPFRATDPATDKGVVDMVGDGIIVPHRRTIKLRAGAPHLMVAIPIGGVDEEDHCECEHCGKVTRVTPGKAYRAPGTVPAELLANFTNIMSPLGVTVSFMFLKNNLSSVLRETMTQHALKEEADFIFYWDDDTIIPGDSWYKMLAKMKMYPDIGAITGVYFTKLDPTEPVLYKDPGKGSYWGFNLDPNAEPEDVFAAGAGCLMVRMDAIRKMEAPYWTDERFTNEDGTLQRISGHDFRFCRKLVEESGMRMTVDGSIQCVHVDVKRQRAFRLPPNAPPMEMARSMSDSFRGAVATVSDDKPAELNLSGDRVDELLGLGAGTNGSSGDHKPASV